MKSSSERFVLRSLKIRSRQCSSKRLSVLSNFWIKVLLYTHIHSTAGTTLNTVTNTQYLIHIHKWYQSLSVINMWYQSHITRHKPKNYCSPTSTRWVATHTHKHTHTATGSHRRRKMGGEKLLRGMCPEAATFLRCTFVPGKMMSGPVKRYWVSGENSRPSCSSISISGGRQRREIQF